MLKAHFRGRGTNSLKDCAAFAAAQPAQRNRVILKTPQMHLQLRRRANGISVLLSDLHVLKLDLKKQRTVQQMAVTQHVWMPTAIKLNRRRRRWTKPDVREPTRPETSRYFQEHGGRGAVFVRCQCSCNVFIIY